jgi:hypothetical protein
MLTIKQHEKLIDRITGLSELEFASLIEDIAVHVRKNKLHHVINSTFIVEETGETIEDLEENLNQLEGEKDDLVDKLFDIEVLCDQAEEIEEYEEKAFESLQSIITKIKDIV